MPGLLPLADGGLLLDERRVVAGVERDGPVVDVEDVRRDVVEEALVVRDDDGAALVRAEELLEPADREDVEVVGRLVEQQHVRPADEHLREQHAELEPARERGEGLAVRRRRDAEALEDGAGARLQGVAVVDADAVLELGEVAGIAGPVDRVALLLVERLPDDGVAHHRDVEDELLVVAGSGPAGARPRGRALGEVHGAVGGRLVAGEHAEERRLPRAVRADQAVARARVELERHALEERACAVGLAEVGGAEHRARGFYRIRRFVVATDGLIIPLACVLPRELRSSPRSRSRRCRASRRPRRCPSTTPTICRGRRARRRCPS